MTNDKACVVDELTVWFKQRLAGSLVQFGDEPMSGELPDLCGVFRAFSNAEMRREINRAAF